MFSVEHHTGRLLEMRIGSRLPADELSEFVAQVTTALRSVKERMVCCTDLRGVRILSPEVADRLTNMMRTDNPRVERNGFLVGEGAVFSMQIERMLREADSPARRSFRDPIAAQTWLAEVLSPAEMRRVKVFLGEGGGHLG